MPLLLSIPEAAAELGLGRTKTYQLIDEGILETVNVGRRRLVPRDSLEAAVARLRDGAEG